MKLASYEMGYHHLMRQQLMLPAIDTMAQKWSLRKQLVMRLKRSFNRDHDHC